MKRILVFACASGLLACSPQAPAAKGGAEGAAEAGEVFTYACASGKTFSVTYDEGFTTATVKSGDVTYKLPAVISGSGARYSDGKAEFWEHQGEAMLNVPPGADGAESCPRKEEPK